MSTKDLRKKLLYDAIETAIPRIAAEGIKKLVLPGLPVCYFGGAFWVLKGDGGKTPLIGHPREGFYAMAIPLLLANGFDLEPEPHNDLRSVAAAEIDAAVSRLDF